MRALLTRKSIRNGENEERDSEGREDAPVLFLLSAVGTVGC